MILTAGQLRYLIHTFLHHTRYRIVELIGSLAVLEVGVCILRSTALMRMLRIHCTFAERLDGIHIRQLGHVFIIDDLYLLDLVRGTESIKEVQERHTSFNGGQMGNQRQIHNFLNGSGSQHGKPSLTASHYVRLITEDVQRLRGQGARAHMEYAGQQFAGDLVHVGDHQQQALGRGKGRGHGAGYQRAVHSASSTRLALHLNDVHRLAIDILTAGRCPFVTRFRHRRGRRNRVDGSYIAERVRNVRGGGIAINGQCLCHMGGPP